MISNELQHIVNKSKEQGEMAFIEAAKEEAITFFEKGNAITLPEKYKEWLLFSDGGELFLPAGIQLYGIEHKPKIDVNDESRPSDEYIVIGAFASGAPILCEKTGEKISIYNQEVGKIEDELIFTDFISFLNELYDLLGIEE